MDQTEKTCVKCAANGFFLAKRTNNNEKLFISGISDTLLVHPDEVKKIFISVKRHWTKSKKTKKRTTKKK